MTKREFLELLEPFDSDIEIFIETPTSILDLTDIRYESREPNLTIETEERFKTAENENENEDPDPEIDVLSCPECGKVIENCPHCGEKI
jgi:hypothetical protein